MVRDALATQGWEITYDWTLHKSVKSTFKRFKEVDLKEIALKEIKGIFDADVVIVLLPGGKGTHTELGMAIAKSKKIIIHSMVPNYFSLCDEIVPFYHQDDICKLTCPFVDLAPKILEWELQEALNNVMINRATPNSK